MTLPAGLATIAAKWDDTPHTRGALAFCRAATSAREAETQAAAVPDRLIDRHAALVVRGGYRMKDGRDDCRR